MHMRSKSCVRQSARRQRRNTIYHHHCSHCFQHESNIAYGPSPLSPLTDSRPAQNRPACLLHTTLFLRTGTVAWRGRFIPICHDEPAHESNKVDRLSFYTVNSVSDFFVVDLVCGARSTRGYITYCTRTVGKHIHSCRLLLRGLQTQPSYKVHVVVNKRDAFRLVTCMIWLYR